MMNFKISTIKKIGIAAMIMAIVTTNVSGQYSISGNNCVFPGPYTIAPYQIIGNLGANYGAGDVWKITNGTINGTSTYTNPGNPYCGGNINWNSGSTTGTLSYYRPGTATTPIATINVSFINAGSIGPSYTAIPKGVLLNVQLTGTDAGSTCTGGSTGVTYQWQKQVNGVYSNIPNATQRDYKIINESFTQTTLFWRIAKYNGQTSYTPSPAVVDSKIAPTVGVVSPSNQFIQPSQPSQTLTSTPSSGGDFPMSISYYWQSSPNSIDWSDIVPGATGLTYTPPLLTQTKFYRIRVVSGPIQIGIYSNVATVKVSSPLEGGLISPSEQANPLTLFRLQ